MPATTAHPVDDIKSYDVRSASIVVGGSRIEDIESFGWDFSKGHEAQATIDNNRIWVKATAEITGSVVMKATSGTIGAMRAIWQADQIMSITGQTAAEDGGSPISIQGCMITDISRSDHEIDGMPTVTVDWEGVEMA